MWASSLGHIDVVQLLVDAGANTDLQDTDELTALDLAKKWGRASETANKDLVVCAPAPARRGTVYDQYRVIPAYRNWKVETTVWDLASFLHYA
jgi:ankyrin repeat protein